MRRTMVNLIACLSIVLSVPAVTVGQVLREGAGERRERLDGMERKPFPFELFNHLTAWTDEAPVTSADMSGKVVLICTWASWYPNSMRVLPLANELQREYRDEGLIVIGVHHPRGFDNAAAVARARGLEFPIAHDATGAFREALLVDQDPDFYVIDRAGQLRYADIETISVRHAVELLIAESREDAAALNERLAEAVRSAQEEFRRTDAINPNVDLRSLPEVVFDPATPEQYEYVTSRRMWPQRPVDPNRPTWGDQTPKALALPEALPAHPAIPSRNGRATIVYFWHPDVLATHDRVMPMMESIQNRHGRDVVVIGVLSTQPGYRPTSGRDDDRFNDPERLSQMFERMARTRQLNHSIAFEPTGQLLASASENINFSSQNPAEAFIAVVVSSDGIIRWSGRPTHAGFQSAIDRVVQVDPGVRNRRLAEQEYIRARMR